MRESEAGDGGDREEKKKRTINQGSCQGGLHCCNLKPKCADSSALAAPSPDAGPQMLGGRGGAIASPRRHSWECLAPFRSAGVHTGLSAGSFGPGALELFTARRLQPFQGGDGWRKKEREGAKRALKSA